MSLHEFWLHSISGIEAPFLTIYICFPYDLRWINASKRVIWFQIEVQVLSVQTIVGHPVCPDSRQRWRRGYRQTVTPCRFCFITVIAKDIYISWRVLRAWSSYLSVAYSTRPYHNLHGYRFWFLRTVELGRCQLYLYVYSYKCQSHYSTAIHLYLPLGSIGLVHSFQSQLYFTSSIPASCQLTLSLRSREAKVTT